jgi:hypothetical protein
MSKNVIEPTAAEGVGTVNQEGDITMEKVYTFRKLESTDVFLMFRIISKIGINDFAECFGKDNVKQMLAKLSDGGTTEGATSIVGISVMLEIVNVIMTNLPACEKEIYQMLSQTSNLSVKQIEKMDMVTFTEMVIDFVKKPEFKDFIKVVSRLYKSEK